MAINYGTLDKIEVYSQIELDAVPDNFRGQVIVCSKEPIVIGRKFEQKVLVTGPTHAIVKNDAVVDGMGKIGLPETICEPEHIEYYDSKETESFEKRWAKKQADKGRDQLFVPYIELHDNSKLEMSGQIGELSCIYVKAKDNSKAIVTGNAYVMAKDNSFISAFGEAKVEQIGNAIVWAYEESSIVVEDKSKITVLEPDTVTLYKPGKLITLYNLWRVAVRQSITKPVVFPE